MKVPVKANDLVASGHGSAEPQRVQGGFRSGPGKTDAFAARNHAAELFGQFNMERRIEAAQPAKFPSRLEYLLQRRMFVAQQCRPVAHRHIEKLASAEIPEPSPFGLAGIHASAPGLVEASAGTHATGNDVSPTFVDGVEFRVTIRNLQFKHSAHDGDKGCHGELCAAEDLQLHLKTQVPSEPESISL